MKEKILYFMHIPWGWIKQRPHFFAEFLAKDYDIDVFFKKPTIVSKKNLINFSENTTESLRIKGFRLIPFKSIPVLKYFNLDWINRLLVSFQLPSFEKYDYIWITSPSIYSMISHFLCKKNKIIYDCMDDAVEFPMAKKNDLLLRKIMNNEAILLSISNIVICSSEYLKNKILERYNLFGKIYVLNNAIALPDSDVLPFDINISEIENEIDKMSFVFMYIGTISEWFDFETVIHALGNNLQANIVLIGPTDISIPKHDRIHHYGTVERKYIFNLMSFADALIMPFQINELIRSVNPVKIYEYIYSVKPIIIARYEETEKFSDFVYLYSTKEEFSEIMAKIINKTKKAVNSEEAMRSFAEKNTWNVRYKQLKSIINECN